MKLSKAARAEFAKAGQIGGLLGGSAGGKKAAENLGPEGRKARSRKALMARDAKRVGKTSE